MRTLEQCKAEVFRRSKIRIKQRKIIFSCALAACVPAVLCVGMWSILILPAMMPASADNMSAQDAAIVYDAESEAITNLQRSAATVYFTGGEAYTLSAADTDAVLTVLMGLDYHPAKVCKCLPQYRIETEFGNFGIHLTEGYARCEKGQAALTREQMEIIENILNSLQQSPEK